MQDPAGTGGASRGAHGRRARRLLRRLALAVGLTSFTALVFALALAVTMPASAVGSLVTLPSQVEALSGSVWRGRAALAGGHVLDWRVSLRALWRGRLVADAGLEGPDTRLSGLLALSPWRVAADDWTGRAGPGLLALAPGLAVASCTSRAVVAVDRLALGRRAAAAQGRVEIAQGACLDGDGREIPVPAMVLRLAADGRDATAVLVRDDATATPLASLRVTGDRRLLVRVEPAGAALVPGMPASAATTLEYPI